MIAQTPGRITVLGFLEADVNCVIGLIGINLFNYMSKFLHETQIPFNQLSYYQQRILCELQVVPKHRQTTSIKDCFTSQESESLNLLMPTVMNTVVQFNVSLWNVPISLGRWGCSCIQSFRCSIASLTRCSFRPNSPLTLSSTSLLGGSIICCDMLCLETQNRVRCSEVLCFYSNTYLYISDSLIPRILKCKSNAMFLPFFHLQYFLKSKDTNTDFLKTCLFVGLHEEKYFYNKKRLTPEIKQGRNFVLVPMFSK